MEMQNRNIDHGKAFDWGRASKEYAKYRDIYPKEFYEKLAELALGIKGQTVPEVFDILHYVTILDVKRV